MTGADETIRGGAEAEGVAPVVVLVHSPLTGAAEWGSLPSVLRARGRGVVVVDVRDDDSPPYAAKFVARAALQVRAAAGDSPVVLVGHSGAGYLLPLLGAARRAARAPVLAYVFLDAGLPPAAPTTRLELARREDANFAGELEALLAEGGVFPDWTSEDLADLVPDGARRGSLVASLRRRGADFFAEPLPVAPDWPDAPCGCLQLSASYDSAANLARMRGWPVLDGTSATGGGGGNVVDGVADRSFRGDRDDVEGVRPGGHFAGLVDPARLADDLESLLRRL